LNSWGRVVDECWHAISDHFPNVDLGKSVVMPNHVHGIIVIHENDSSVGARHASPLPSNPPHGVIPNSLGAIVGSFKSAVTRRLRRELVASPIWQRGFYDHVIRDDLDWTRIHNYIESNPMNWADDLESPEKRSG
jgi:putative transposase